MYVPKQFQESRIERLAEAIRDIELATVVTAVEGRYYTSHIPMTGCWKMIQHRSQGDRSGAIAGLLESDKQRDREVGAIMQNLDRDRLS